MPAGVELVLHYEEKQMLYSWKVLTLLILFDIGLHLIEITLDVIQWMT